MSPFKLYQFIASNYAWINLILVGLVIYMGRHKSSRSTMIWLMALALFPVIGFIPYLLMGKDTRRRNMFRLKAEQDKYVQRETALQWMEISESQREGIRPGFEDYSELIGLNLRLDRSVVTTDNEVRIFTDGASKFHTLLEDIENAHATIEMQYYIVKSDRLGKAVMDALIRAAKRGVKIRFLTDGLGGRDLKKSDVNRLRAAGVHTAEFFPSLLSIINLRMNYRNHRKLVIIDDKIGYIGGFNVGDEYVGRYPRFGNWRDTHLRIDGGATVDLKIRFLMDWYYASGEDPAEEPDIKPQGNPEGNIPCQLVTSGPDTEYPNIKYALIKMIQSANHEIYIQTPYFIPDATVMEILLVAIQQGVKVNLMIPDRPDHPVVYPATLSHAGELIRHGASVYRYEGGFLHSKVILIDDFISMVGSANVDERSFSLNFEASEIVYSKKINRRLRRAFEEDVRKSTLLTAEVYEKRSLWMKIRQPLCRLASPIL
ncbi:MAG: cardiolipin synthase [Peptoniphilaceae bacterium]|nr:cardiolipin synthase [Peptoniphilaceae bacterium]MDD7433433.1 cardiolipin synthase [Peptoniphilaceae bacterium]MDY3076199.1 cardiolipin synthase [Peptoniphilaceae bacterium]MDY3986485.1 cardiolipin synthase [Peptoniphilaceae bacterium]